MSARDHRAALDDRTLDALSWMTGYWVDDRDGARAEELWTHASGDLMLGLSRTIRDGGRVFSSSCGSSARYKGSSTSPAPPAGPPYRLHWSSARVARQSSLTPSTTILSASSTGARATARSVRESRASTTDRFAPAPGLGAARSSHPISDDRAPAYLCNRHTSTILICQSASFSVPVESCRSNLPRAKELDYRYASNVSSRDLVCRAAPAPIGLSRRDHPSLATRDADHRPADGTARSSTDSRTN